MQGLGKGQDSIVRSLILHLGKRLFSRFEPVQRLYRLLLQGLYY